MRTVELAGAIADPHEMRRAVEPGSAERVAPRERFLVAEKQRLVGRVEVDLVELELVVEHDAARRHEVDGTVDLPGESLVAAPFRTRRHELEVPVVHP